MGAVLFFPSVYYSNLVCSLVLSDFSMPISTNSVQLSENTALFADVNKYLRFPPPL